MSLSVSERMGRVMPSATSAMLGLAAQLREDGKNVISLGAGEPDFDTPDHIKEAAIQAIRDGHTKYTAIDGTASLKAAIGRKFERDNELIYSHPVYQYFERRYNLPGRSLHWEPNAMPDDEQWRTLQRSLNNASLFIWEAQPDPAIAARMTALGLAFAVVNPAANHGNKDWLLVQRENLQRLAR